MKNIKFIYFDIGGVMLDFSQYFKSVTKKFNLSVEEFNNLFFEVDEDITRGKITPQDLWKKAITKFNLTGADEYNFVESWMSDYVPRKEIHDLALALSKKYKIGIISNIYHDMMPRLIELGIVADVNYSAIILSSETGFRKPEKEIYELATNESKVKSEEILLIDDRKDFIEGAKNYGWQTLWFDEKNIDKTIGEIERLL